MEIIKDFIQGTPQTPTQNRFIVVHDTGNDKSTIDGEVSYMKRAGLQNQAYVTHFVDDKKVVQTAPSGKISWGAGNINQFAYAQIEMVHVAPDKFSQQVELLGQLLKQLCSESGIPGYFTNGTNNGIITHNQAAKYFGGSDHTDPDSYVISRGWTMDKFRGRISEIINSQSSQAPKPTQVKLEDLTLSVPFRAKGACWVSNPDGAIIYKDAELKEPTSQVVPFGSAWQIYGAGDGGIFTIGNNLYISQSDAVAKFSRGMGMGDYTGMTAVVTADDCYTQTIPEAGQAGVSHLEKGGAYRINRQSQDFKFVDLGKDQWVDTSKLNIVL
ncbi:peptidoglycan recognition family protein [Holzapfeliella sp. He02]|uniref:Peptidoglycan recognition family protein n=1 Tax=Holzapfeliella saturejae TaxID=3082953 RepID=A0ABU8SHC7_9LACO